MSVKHFIARIIVRIGAFDPDDHDEPGSETFRRTLEQMEGHGNLAFGFIFTLILTSPVWVPILLLRELRRRLTNR
jgi:hypothetical protein